MRFYCVCQIVKQKKKRRKTFNKISFASHVQCFNVIAPTLMAWHAGVCLRYMMCAVHPTGPMFYANKITEQTNNDRGIM